MTVTSTKQLAELFAAGRYHDLIAAAQSAQISPQADPTGAQFLAAALFSVGEFGAAAPMLEELEPAFGLNPEFLSLFAANCRRLGQLQRAEELFVRALQINPESPQIRNNQANLLIDLCRFDEAREILTRLLDEQPDYDDARTNLNRLSFLNQSSPPQSSHGQQSRETVQGWSLADPLLLAFSDEEVSQYGLRKPAKSGPEAATLLESLPDADERAMALEQLDQANKAVAEQQFAFALQLCSQVLRVLGSHAPVYDCASDAYLNLRKFHEAEICLLQAMALDAPTPKRCLNLVSFASMRGDIALAQHHLRQAASLDPSHPQLEQIRANLAKREQTAGSMPYAFQLAWELPQATKRSE
tara:strand:- start:40 stop:1110 length:1071 start_codon:yes stop_codon:yes gene_type:complete